MSHRCHRLRAQNVSLQAHAIVFTVSPRGKFPPLPIFDHRRVGISSWNIVCCCNKSELKLIITLSSYHIICSHNQVVAIAVYRPYHQTASSVSTIVYHPHHIVGGLGGYWRRCIGHLASPIHLIYPQWYGDATIRLPLVSSGQAVGGLPPNDGASYTIIQVHPLYWCVDEQIINTPNKRMVMSSIHSYETVCASIAMDGGD